MSDRVLRRGGRITAGEIAGQGCLALVDSAVKQNWIFKAAANANEVGAGTSYPVGMTLDHLVEMYWLWREIQVYGEIYVPISQQTDTVTTTRERRVYPSSAAGGKLVEREGELVLGAVWNVVQTESYPDAGVDVKIFSHLVADNVKVHNGLYYPYILCAMLDSLDVNATASSVKLFGVGTPSGTATLTMSDGAVYSVQLYGATASIDITVNSYWAHKKADGTPKYNTATGAKL